LHVFWAFGPEDVLLKYYQVISLPLRARPVAARSGST